MQQSAHTPYPPRTLPCGAVMAEERFGAWCREAAPLFEAHWREIGRHQEVFELAPDWARLVAMDGAGALAAYTLRAAGALAGYATYMLGQPVNYRQAIWATCHIIWVRPWDRGRSGAAFLRYTERALWARTVPGVDKIVHHCKHTNQLAQVLLSMGFERAEIVVDKVRPR